MAQEDGNDAPIEANRGLQLHFFERASRFPLMGGIADLVSRRYAGIKSHSTTLAAAFATAEGAAVAVAQRCGPMAKAYLGHQLEQADALACRALDQVEKLCPAVQRRPEEIVAGAIDFGRKKADELKRCSQDQAEWIRQNVAFAAFIATESAVAVLGTARDLINRSFMEVDEVLDLWISLHHPDHEPGRNNVGASPPLAELTITTFLKLQTALALQLACESNQIKQIGNSMYDYLHGTLHNTPSSARPATTIRAHVIAAVQHTILAFSFLPESAAHVSKAVYERIMELYHSYTPLHGPIQDVSSDSSSSPQPSSSEDSFQSQL